MGTTVRTHNNRDGGHGDDRHNQEEWAASEKEGGLRRREAEIDTARQRREKARI